MSSCLFTPFSLSQIQTGRHFLCLNSVPSAVLDQELDQKDQLFRTVTAGHDLWVRTKRRRLWLQAFERRGEGHPILLGTFLWTSNWETPSEGLTWPGNT